MSRSTTDTDGDGLPDDVDLDPQNAAPLTDLGIPGGPPYELISSRLGVDPPGKRGVPLCPGTQSDEPEEDVPDACTDRPGANAVLCYAPLVYVHDGEGHRPMSAELFAEASQLKWSKNNCRDKNDFVAGDLSAPDLARLGGRLKNPYEYDPDNEFCDGSAERPFLSSELTRPHLPLCEDPPDGGPCKSTALGNKVEGFYLEPYETLVDGGLLTGATVDELVGGDVPVYVQYSPFEYVAYWFFWGYSTPAGGVGDLVRIAHQGDWEHLVVHLDNTDTATSVEYFFHHWSQIVDWDDVNAVQSADEKAIDSSAPATHPVVYAAREGHGSYPTLDCNFEVRRPSFHSLGDIGNFAMGRTWDDCSDGPQWQTWNNLVNVLDTGWYGFGGAWGRVGHGKNTTGPPGPHPAIDPTSRGREEIRHEEHDPFHDVVIGATIDLLLSGYAPNSPILFTFFSTPVDGGSTTADGDGNVDVKVTVPDALTPGDHTLEVLGVAGDGALRAINISFNARSPDKVTAPPATGAGLALVALIVVVVGSACLVAVARLRRRDT